MYIASIDATKAFDKINRTLLWRTLIEKIGSMLNGFVIVVQGHYSPFAPVAPTCASQCPLGPAIAFVFVIVILVFVKFTFVLSYDYVLMFTYTCLDPPGLAHDSIAVEACYIIELYSSDLK